MAEESSSGPSHPRTTRLRELIRQNSSKLFDVAETVALPQNKRSVKRYPKSDKKDVELQIPNSATKEISSDPNKRYFPFFIIITVLVQICFMLFSHKWIWLTLCYDPYRRHEVWRLISVFIVHRSLGHLVWTVAFEIILGLPLEAVHGTLRIGTIFISGVIGGCLALAVLDPKTYAVGGISGVYGLLAAHFITLLLNWDQMEQKFIRICLLLVHVAFDVILALYLPEPNVSHVGNVGGVVAGLIAATFILRNFEILVWEKHFQKIIGLVGALLILGLVIFNVAFPTEFFATEFNFEYVDTYRRYFVIAFDTDDRFASIRDSCAGTADCADIFKNVNVTIPGTITINLNWNYIWRILACAALSDSNLPHQPQNEEGGFVKVRILQRGLAKEFESTFGLSLNSTRE